MARVPLRWSLVVVLGAVSALACGGSTSLSSVGAPEGVRCLTAVDPRSASVPHGGGRVDVSVAAERECAWSVEATATWVRPSRTSGQGTATVAVTVEANGRGVPREAIVSVNDAQLNITQAPAPCAFALTVTNALMSHTGGQTRISVATAEGCVWQAAANVPWLQVDSAQRQGPGTVDVLVLPNGGAQREGAVTIGGRSLTIVQSAVPPAAPPPVDPVPPPPDPAPVPPPADPLPPPPDPAPVPPPADPVPPPPDPDPVPAPDPVPPPDPDPVPPPDPEPPPLDPDPVPAPDPEPPPPDPDPAPPPDPDPPPVDESDAVPPAEEAPTVPTV